MNTKAVEGTGWNGPSLFLKFMVTCRSEFMRSWRLIMRTATSSFAQLSPYHRSKWEKLRKDDWALFYKEGLYYAFATIMFKWHLDELATSVFGSNRTPKGEIWDLFCFFGPPREVDITKEEINDAIGYISDRQLFGFTVIDDPVKVTRVVELIASA